MLHSVFLPTFEKKGGPRYSNAFPKTAEYIPHLEISFLRAASNRSSCQERLPKLIYDNAITL